MFAVAGAKADEREVLLGMLEADAALVRARPGQTLIGDKNYFGRDFEKTVTESDLVLLRPVRKGEAPRAGKQLFKPLRQVMESVNQTLKAQLDLEGHGGRTGQGISPASFTVSWPLPLRSGTTTRPARTSSGPHRLRPLTATAPPGINHLELSGPLDGRLDAVLAALGQDRPPPPVSGGPGIR